MNDIELENVRTNNLKSVSVSIPVGELTLVCGVSGSGKSSLVFNTLAAIGQQRFLETLSASAQSLLATLPSPDVDRADFIPPTIALKQDEPSERATATVGTATDLLGLTSTLFANAGDWLCPECELALAKSTTADVARYIAEQPVGSRILVGFPTDHLGKSLSDRLMLLEAGRVNRVLIGGELHRISDIDSDTPNRSAGTIYGVLDRVTVGRSEPARIIETVELAFRSGNGSVAIVQEDESGWQPCTFHESLACPNGHVVRTRLSEQCLTHQSPQGVCGSCKGHGGENSSICPACAGSRVAEWGDRSTLHEILYRNLLLTPIEDWTLPTLGESFAVISSAIDRRIKILQNLGLGHLTLARGVDSLSSGERLRVRLAGTVAAESVETLFVLDEPIASLHPADARQVVDVIQELKRNNNTIVVVDHSSAFLDACNRVLEIGPQAGAHGGEIVYDGVADQFLDASTRTGRAFGDLISLSHAASKPPSNTLKIGPLTGERLPIQPVEIIVGGINILTGRSGAGKTTLLHGLLSNLAHRLETPSGSDHGKSDDALPFDAVQFVDQRPPARGSRSCLATHVKVYDDIRKLFAAVPEARARGWTARHFSFNTSGGGRCEYCLGRGEVDVPMGTLQDLAMTCPKCSGRRYESTFLTVKFRRRSIADVLQMTVDEAVPFFRTEPHIQRKLQPIRDVGLGYVTLGQPSTTLSGGENQRLHLAAYLTPNSRGPVLFLLDEPARGLHPDDAKTLCGVFERLASVGHSLVVAEHQLALLSIADRVIDLEHGDIAFAGTTAELIHSGSTATAVEVKTLVASS